MIDKKNRKVSDILMLLALLSAILFNPITILAVDALKTEPFHGILYGLVDKGIPAGGILLISIIWDLVILGISKERSFRLRAQRRN